MAGPQPNPRLAQQASVTITAALVRQTFRMATQGSVQPLHLDRVSGPGMYAAATDRSGIDSPSPAPDER
jgi:hypothetical protein